jgi:hypothetical protein
MKTLLVGLLVLGTVSASASDLNSSEVKVGLLANYYHIGLMERIVGKVTKVYSDGKVEITAGLSVTKKISNVGIQIESGCLEEVCVGDYDRYFHAGLLENFTNKVLAVYDNGYVQIANGGDFTLRKVSRVSKVLNP